MKAVYISRINGIFFIQLLFHWKESVAELNYFISRQQQTMSKRGHNAKRKRENRCRKSKHICDKESQYQSTCEIYRSLSRTIQYKMFCVQHLKMLHLDNSPENYYWVSCLFSEIYLAVITSPYIKRRAI